VHIDGMGGGFVGKSEDEVVGVRGNRRVFVPAALVGALSLKSPI